ncbi:hypothetical protein Dda_5758 [Drechslerella dactyloides]|uniref:Acid phosphatase n=1 Tax=Drechslerella dactyloides TaxID=74499 RepID=A0AAD6NJC0_DREDA|nr:hypothetical protein Dda_5758 [Drechslerella dactyloides]
MLSGRKTRFNTGQIGRRSKLNHEGFNVRIHLVPRSSHQHETSIGWEMQGNAVNADYTSSPVSYVKGKSFNRFVTIWLENTDFKKAERDPNIDFFAQKGITLTNYFGLTHPSEPNYVAAFSGDYYGINNDDDNIIPANVSTVADLLEEKDISWGAYMEFLPSTGYTGVQFKEPKTRKNGYVKKHNPPIMHSSVANNADRRALVKNFTMFDEDLENNRLPQWNNGHDTSVTYAGEWLRDWLEPLLDNPHFINNTLVLITFDENENYAKQNRVFSILLGDVIPKDLIGTEDDAYYNHYSEISTVEANWQLSTLGRYDVGANVFSIVGEKTGDKIRDPEDIDDILNNHSYGGIFNSHHSRWAPQPVPDTKANFAGRKVLESVRRQWGDKQANSPYKGAPLMVPTYDNPPVYPQGYRRRRRQG